MIKLKYKKVDKMSNIRKKYNDSWMYILLLSTLVILTESVKTFKFTLLNSEITYAIFLLPIIYALTNYITKKYGLKRTLIGIVVSLISMILFVMLMNFAIGKDMDFGSLYGAILGYLVSQIVNTMIYKFLLVNTNSPYLLILLNYIFAYIVFYMIYTIVHLDMIILDTFWISYFIVLVIQIIISIVLAIIDKKIQVGIGEDD